MHTVLSPAALSTGMDTPAQRLTAQSSAWLQLAGAHGPEPVDLVGDESSQACRGCLITEYDHPRCTHIAACQLASYPARQRHTGLKTHAAKASKGMQHPGLISMLPGAQGRAYPRRQWRPRRSPPTVGCPGRRRSPAPACPAAPARAPPRSAQSPRGSAALPRTQRACRLRSARSRVHASAPSGVACQAGGLFRKALISLPPRTQSIARITPGFSHTAEHVTYSRSPSVGAASIWEAPPLGC